MPLKRLLVTLLLCIACTTLHAQVIKGEVMDMDSKLPVVGVSIQNIYTSVNIATSPDGQFLITANKDELLEFKKAGYKTVHVRIPKGYVPSYFKIIMQQGFPDLNESRIAQSNRYNYHNDSIRFHNIYQHELDFPRMSTFDAIQSPFSAMSKKNREIWRFQDEYEATEKEKYVDHTFNEALITRVSGLSGDSLQHYMRRYRPTYEQLMGMNDYTFYNYIRQSVYGYRNSRNTPRGAQ